MQAIQRRIRRCSQAYSAGQGWEQRGQLPRWRRFGGAPAEHHRASSALQAPRWPHRGEARIRPHGGRQARCETPVYPSALTETELGLQRAALLVHVRISASQLGFGGADGRQHVVRGRVARSVDGVAISAQALQMLNKNDTLPRLHVRRLQMLRKLVDAQGDKNRNVSFSPDPDLTGIRSRAPLRARDGRLRCSAANSASGRWHLESRLRQLSCPRQLCASTGDIPAKSYGCPEPHCQPPRQANASGHLSAVGPLDWPRDATRP